MSRHTLRLRLAVSFTLIAGAILLAFLPAVYILIRNQMSRDMDRQLSIDSALIEAHLQVNGQGGIQWRKNSPATPDSAGYAESWFDVWAGKENLLKHWPHYGAEVSQPPAPPGADAASFLSVPLNDGRPARTFQKPVTIGGRTVTLRVFRDESAHRATLSRILTGLALGMPLAVLLAGLAGYAMAGRALRPVGDMAAAARRINSDSLGSRLPNPNPHDELGRLASVFNDTLQRIESSFDALKRFTSDASHELRTPLTALRSTGEVALREERSAGELRETIGSMLEEAQRLNDLTDTLLLLARAESGRMPLHAEDFPLEDLIREVCERLEVLSAEKNQRIEITAEPGISLKADRVLLRQAITNLLHNAIRHSPPDSLIVARTATRGAETLIEITDQGPGIAPGHRGKIFERFYRIDKARARTDGGTGLGLAIAKLFVEQHGGRIELDPPAAGGSCFRIVFPAP